MSTDVTAVPATTSSTKLKLGELLTTGPQSIAFLSALLLTSSANEDFSLGKKGTLLTQPGSFKTSAQQVVNATDKAYVANDAAFNSMRFTLSQVPQSINIFLVLLNQGSADEINSLGQNTLTDISKQITKAVEFSVKAEKSFDDLLALVQELLLGTLATPGGQALQQVEQNVTRDARIAFEEARKRFEEASKSIPADWALAGDSVAKSLADSNPTAAQSTSASAEALRGAQASIAAAQKQFDEASKNMPSGWDLIGMQTIDQADKARATAALSSAQASFSDAQKQFDEASKSMPSGWDLVGMQAVGSTQADTAAKARAAAALSSAQASFSDAQKQFNEASKNMPSGWDLVGMQTVDQVNKARAAAALSSAQASFSDAQKQFNEASKNMPSGWDLVGMQAVGSPQADMAAKARAAAALRSTQASLSDAQKQFDAAVKDLPSGWDLVGQSVVGSITSAAIGAAATLVGADAPAAQPTAASAEALRAAKASLEATQKAFQNAIKDLPSGWDLVGMSVVESLSSSTQAAKPTPAVVRGPVPNIVEYLRKMIDSYQRHTAQIKQITQLLRSAQAVTDKAAPKAVEGLHASLSSSDQTNAVAAPKEGVVTLSLQRDTVIQQGQNLLEIVEAVNGVCAVYLKVNKDYTLAGQRKLGEMIQFPEGRTLARDDKAFLARLDEEKAEVLKANDETTKKILELYGGV